MATRDPNITGSGLGPVADEAWGCGWVYLWFWLFFMVLLFAGWGWGGWYRGWNGPWNWWGSRPAPPPQATAPQTAPQTSHPPPAAPASDEFLGKTVTVSGQVDKVFGPQAFTLAASLGGRTLLVVSKDQKTPSLEKGETIQITGTVEPYSADQFHQQTGVDLSQVPAAEFGGRPAVVASSITAKSTTASQ